MYVLHVLTQATMNELYYVIFITVMRSFNCVASSVTYLKGKRYVNNHK